MGERRVSLPGDQGTDAKRHLLMQQYLNQVDALFLEYDVEIEPDRKKDLLAQIERCMEQLGIHDYDELSMIRLTLIRRRDILVTPKDFPSLGEFTASLHSVITLMEAGEVPPVSERPTALDVSKYARVVDPYHIGVRHGSRTLEEYEYELAQFLCDEFIYSNSINKADTIHVNSEWIARRGRHRTLALRSLGPDFVKSSGLNEWVSVTTDSREIIEWLSQIA